MPDPLLIGSLLFPDMDQADFTGPFEVLSRIPDSRLITLAKSAGSPRPLRDFRGLILTPETALSNCPPLDILHLPGGPGQQALMEDAEVLAFIRTQAKQARYIFCVCTGALIAGAAGLLKGRRATTHWASVELLPLLGALPSPDRVVVDGNLITTAGVTGGIDGALRLAALLRGDAVAQEIQLYMQYAPEPPFNAGSPESAPPEILAAVRKRFEPLITARRRTAEKIASNLR